MTTVYLTRHGQTEWNLEKRLQGRGNSPLTEFGIARAKDLANRVKDMDIDVIYTSPIERAFKTAKIINEHKGVEIIPSDGLMEMSFGEFEGKKIDEILEEYKWDVHKAMNGDLEMRAPNGETLGEVRERVKNEMDKLILENEGKSILIVTHGVTLKALLHYFNDTNINSEVMGQTTLTKVVVDKDKKFVIEFKNDDSHFLEKLSSTGW